MIKCCTDVPGLDGRNHPKAVVGMTPRWNSRCHSHPWCSRHSQDHRCDFGPRNAIQYVLFLLVCCLIQADLLKLTTFYLAHQWWNFFHHSFPHLFWIETLLVRSTYIWSILAPAGSSHVAVVTGVPFLRCTVMALMRAFVRGGSVSAGRVGALWADVCLCCLLSLPSAMAPSRVSLVSDPAGVVAGGNAGATLVMRCNGVLWLGPAGLSKPTPVRCLLLLSLP